MLRFRGKKDILIRSINSTKGRDNGRFISVADVVLPTVGFPAISIRCQHHIGRINIGTVRFLGETESEDATIFEGLSGFLAHRLVSTHPDRTQAEYGDLPGIPILKAVEPKDLGKLTNTPSIPAGIQRALTRRSIHRGHQAMFFGIVKKVRIPTAVVVVADEALLPLGLKEFNGVAHQFTRSIIIHVSIGISRVEKNHQVLPIFGFGKSIQTGFSVSKSFQGIK